MPNNRLARSARVLVDQVLAKFPDAEWNGAAEPDGFRVIRAVRFTGAEVTDYLARVLPILHPEEDRLVAVAKDNATSITVTFTGTTAADRTTPFALDAAEVLAAEDERTEEDAFRDETPASEVEEKPKSKSKAKSEPVTDEDTTA